MTPRSRRTIAWVLLVALALPPSAWAAPMPTGRTATLRPPQAEVREQRNGLEELLHQAGQVVAKPPSPVALRVQVVNELLRTLGNTVPVVTPLMGRDGQLVVDRERAQRYFHYLRNTMRVDAVLVVGKTGECDALGPDLRAQAIRVLTHEAHRITDWVVFTHVTGADAAETLRNAQIATTAGADALVLAPTAFLETDHQIELFVRRLWQTYPAWPILLYNNPALGRSLSPALVSRLWNWRLVAGLKDSSGEMAQFQAYLKTGIPMSQGDERHLHEAIAAGAARGVVVRAVGSSGNFWPLVNEAATMSDAAVREAAQRVINETLPIVTADGKIPAAVKYLLSQRTADGISLVTPIVMTPHTSALTPEQTARLDQLVLPRFAGAEEQDSRGERLRDSLARPKRGRALMKVAGELARLEDAVQQGVTREDAKSAVTAAFQKAREAFGQDNLQPAQIIQALEEAKDMSLRHLPIDPQAAGLKIDVITSFEGIEDVISRAGAEEPKEVLGRAAERLPMSGAAPVLTNPGQIQPGAIIARSTLGGQVPYYEVIKVGPRNPQGIPDAITLHEVDPFGRQLSGVSVKIVSWQSLLDSRDRLLRPAAGAEEIESAVAAWVRQQASAPNVTPTFTQEAIDAFAQTHTVSVTEVEAVLRKQGFTPGPLLSGTYASPHSLPMVTRVWHKVERTPLPLIQAAGAEEVETADPLLDLLPSAKRADFDAAVTVIQGWTLEHLKQRVTDVLDSNKPPFEQTRVDRASGRTVSYESIKEQQHRAALKAVLIWLAGQDRHTASPFGAFEVRRQEVKWLDSLVDQIDRSFRDFREEDYGMGPGDGGMAWGSTDLALLATIGTPSALAAVVKHQGAYYDPAAGFNPLVRGIWPENLGIARMHALPLVLARMQRVHVDGQPQNYSVGLIEALANAQREGSLLVVWDEKHDPVRVEEIWTQPWQKVPIVQALGRQNKALAERFRDSDWTLGHLYLTQVTYTTPSGEVSLRGQHGLLTEYHIPERNLSRLTELFQRYGVVWPRPAARAGAEELTITADTLKRLAPQWAAAFRTQAPVTWSVLYDQVIRPTRPPPGLGLWQFTSWLLARPLPSEAWSFTTVLHDELQKMTARLEAAPALITALRAKAEELSGGLTIDELTAVAQQAGVADMGFVFRTARLLGIRRLDADGSDSSLLGDDEPGVRVIEEQVPGIDPALLAELPRETKTIVLYGGLGSLGERFLGTGLKELRAVAPFLKVQIIAVDRWDPDDSASSEWLASNEGRAFVRARVEKTGTTTYRTRPPNDPELALWVRDQIRQFIEERQTAIGLTFLTYVPLKKFQALVGDDARVSINGESVRVDGVIPAVPTGDHLNLARFWIEHNVPVWMDKPITMIAQVDELRALAKAHPGTVMGVDFFMYSDALLWLLSEGRAQTLLREIGDIQRIDGRCVESWGLENENRPWLLIRPVSGSDGLDIDTAVHPLAQMEPILRTLGLSLTQATVSNVFLGCYDPRPATAPAGAHTYFWMQGQVGNIPLYVDGGKGVDTIYYGITVTGSQGSVEVFVGTGDHPPYVKVSHADGRAELHAFPGGSLGYKNVWLDFLLLLNQSQRAVGGDLGMRLDATTGAVQAVGRAQQWVADHGVTVQDNPKGQAPAVATPVRGHVDAQAPRNAATKDLFQQTASTTGAEEVAYYDTVEAATAAHREIGPGGRIEVPQGFEQGAVMVLDSPRFFSHFVTEDGPTRARAILRDLGLTGPLEMTSIMTQETLPDHAIILTDTASPSGDLEPMWRPGMAVINVNTLLTSNDLLEAVAVQQFERLRGVPIDRVTYRVDPERNRIYAFFA